MRLMRDRLYAYLFCYPGGFLKRAMAGTLEYMAPEVLQKRPASHASDVYALAITVNELATGALYWMYCCYTGCTAVVLDVLYCCCHIAVSCMHDGMGWRRLPMLAVIVYFN